MGGIAADDREWKQESYHENRKISVPIFNASNDATVAVLSVFMAETNFKENQLDYYLQKLKSNGESIGNTILRQ